MEATVDYLRLCLNTKQQQKGKTLEFSPYQERLLLLRLKKFKKIKKKLSKYFDWEVSAEILILILYTCTEPIQSTF